MFWEPIPRYSGYWLTGTVPMRMGPAAVIGQEGQNYWLARTGRYILPALDYVRMAEYEEVSGRGQWGRRQHGRGGKRVYRLESSGRRGEKFYGCGAWSGKHFPGWSGMEVKPGEAWEEAENSGDSTRFQEGGSTAWSIRWCAFEPENMLQRHFFKRQPSYSGNLSFMVKTTTSATVWRRQWCRE